jgi:signal transduction histidine kinase
MTRLYELGSHCARTGESFEQCLERILETALLMTRTTKGFIQIPDSASGHLKIAAHRGFGESVLRSFARGEGGGAADWPPAAPMGHRVVIADVTKSEFLSGQPLLALLLAADVRAAQFTPLLSSTGQLLGAISTHFDRPHQPDERELRLLDLLARQAADYLERKRAEEQLRKRGERLLLLSDTLSQLLNASDPNTIVRELFRNVAAHLGVDTYFNFMVDPAGDALVLHSCAGIPEDSLCGIQRLEFGQAICGTVAQTRRPIHATDIQNSTYEKANLVRGFGIQCYACNPLIVGGDLLGTLSFASRSRPAFEEEELQFLRIISQHTAIALERLRSAGQLEKAVQERTASLQDAISQMEEFNYTVSHDLRAPLRGMQAFSEALLQDYAPLLPDEGKHFLNRIAANASRLDKMILDILSLTRHARAEMRIDRIDLGRLVRQIVELYPAMQSPVAQMEIQSLHAARGHEPSLAQAISNLLNNAVKFVAPGVRPVVRVWTEPRDRRVRLWIADNGIGVNPKYQHRLFGIFERVHTDLNYDGTGVGLAIVRKTVERMGGDVGMESDGVNGSRFWIELEASEEG